MLNEIDSVIVDALKEAGDLHQTYLGSEHLLLAILKNNRLAVTGLLKSYGMSYASVRQDILELNYYYGTLSHNCGYSQAVQHILEEASNCQSIILEMLRQKDSLAFCLLHSYEIFIENVMN